MKKDIDTGCTQHIGDAVYVCQNYKEAFVNGLYLFLTPKYQCGGVESLKRNLLEHVLCLNDTYWDERGHTQRWLNHRLRKIQGLKSEEEVQVFIYNEILTQYGCGLLPGFGMANSHGDALYGDPEKQSLVPQTKVIQ